MKANTIHPVIDLFAGPGGLGEGFASLHHPMLPSHYAFKTVISIEKDVSSHQTLKLRHFYRNFQLNTVPDDYYHYLENRITLEELYKRHPVESAHADHTAWLCTLGEAPHEDVKKRIIEALNYQKKWVLVGGPPCQAYSLVGRSRMKGQENFENDPRHFLYREYLRILIDHKPPIFVMENVKGLISSKIQGRYVINDILRDLSNPSSIIDSKSSGLEYKLYSLSQPGIMNLTGDPSNFVVKAEEYGIPQARHRIFILGIRSDIDIVPKILEKVNLRRTVSDAIGDLPKIRSGISKGLDSNSIWLETLTEMTQQSWFKHGKENGLASLAEYIEMVLESIEVQLFEKDSTTYSQPDHFLDWFHDKRLKILLSHEARSHMKSDLQRYFFSSTFAQVYDISPKLSDFPKELLPAHKNITEGISGKKFADRFRVQLSDTPSTTVTSHISKDGHYYIHYDPIQCRSLTVREAARLQTFPDNYKFEGNRTSQYHQVGNAVPPLLANKIASIVFDILERME
ncbi:DNA cytosine methyltransferase [Herpetosiphon llansteffanensis]|uniref:DNA cytosine methyltransferase n=1 Tax=Herpetosiphon llansteffanensis TaxID=2094568 RepID=UPI000D7C97FA|nr:DNA cytosine methyltransferase [Herpetosiphon llansteffanensis]